MSLETEPKEPILIRDRYFIEPGKPIPELDQPSAKAYTAEDRRDLSRKFYALACTPGMPIRIETIKAIQGKHHRGLLPLVDWDVTAWPPVGQSTPVIIYERPLGGSIFHHMQRKKTRITAHDIRHKFSPPLIDGLKAAMEKLVTSHLRLVAKIAMGYRGYGLLVSDLIAEGNIGMMQAVNKFDPDRGFRLSTYAMWWIRASIQEYILHSWSLVKMGTTAAQKKLFFNLRKLKAHIGVLDDGDLRPDHVTRISNRLQVSETEVIKMNQRLSRGDHSLNTPLYEESDGEWQDFLIDEGDSQEIRLGEAEELSARRKLLQNAMKGLSQRERHIITERRIKDSPSTLQNLSDQYGISRERVRQIEVRAFEKLRKTMKNTLIDQHMMH